MHRNETHEQTPPRPPPPLPTFDVYEHFADGPLLVASALAAPRVNATATGFTTTLDTSATTVSTQQLESHATVEQTYSIEDWLHVVLFAPLLLLNPLMSMSVTVQPLTEHGPGTITVHIDLNEYDNITDDDEYLNELNSSTADMHFPTLNALPDLNTTSNHAATSLNQTIADSFLEYSMFQYVVHDTPTPSTYDFSHLIKFVNPPDAFFGTEAADVKTRQETETSDQDLVALVPSEKVSPTSLASAPAKTPRSFESVPGDFISGQPCSICLEDLWLRKTFKEQGIIFKLEHKTTDSGTFGHASHAFPPDQAELDVTSRNEVCSTSLGKRVVQLPCKHLFHETCVMKWLHQTYKCPYCRDCLLRRQRC